MIVELLLFSFIAASQSVESGIWQAKTTFEVNGLPLPETKDEQCVDAADAKDIKKAITKNLGEKGCEATKWVVKGKSVAIELKCDMSGLNAVGKMSGTVDKKSYDLKGSAEGDFQGIPSAAKITMKGKWLKTCPKPA